MMNLNATIHAALSLLLPVWPRRETAREALGNEWGTYQAAQSRSMWTCKDHAETIELLSGSDLVA